MNRKIRLPVHQAHHVEYYSYSQKDKTDRVHDGTGPIEVIGDQLCQLVTYRSWDIGYPGIDGQLQVSQKVIADHPAQSKHDQGRYC